MLGRAMMRRLPQPVVPAVLVCAFLSFVACAGTEQAASSGPVMEAASSFRSGQIIDTTNEESISIEELMRRLLRQEVVYLGEEHHNRFHIETALSLLNSLSRAGRRPVVAMEMFGWESQPLLDRYVQGDDLTRRDFLNQVGWAQNWGGPFETYEPLVIFTKTEHLRLVALNPPKTLVRLVAKKGLAQARLEEDWTRSSMQEETIVDDPSYRQKILEQLRACHDGGSDDMYQKMYEASMVRDEGMAKTIVSLVKVLRGSADPVVGPVISYTGGGHVQYNLPVPQRVARRLSGTIRQTSIYMTSYSEKRREELREMLTSRIADYIWLTPLSEGGMPRRCR